MKPEPIAFHCPRCDKRWDNPAAVDPAVGFASIYNQSEPRLCATCSERRAKLTELTRLTEDAGGYDAEELAFRSKP